MDDDEIRSKSGDELCVGRKERADFRKLRHLWRKAAERRDADDAIAESEREQRFRDRGRRRDDARGNRPRLGDDPHAGRGDGEQDDEQTPRQLHRSPQNALAYLVSYLAYLAY